MTLLLRNAFAQIKVVTANEEIMTEVQFFITANSSGFLSKQHQIVPGALSAWRETWDIFTSN